MSENFEEYRDFVQLMRTAPKLNASEGFTDKVLMALPKRASMLQRMASYWIMFFHRAASLREVNQPAHLNPRECSFYFFITSFFYLIMGIVLMSGFKEFSSNVTAMEWLKLQPQVTLGIALWLFTLGAGLMMNGRIIIRLARLGTLFYILFTIANGVLIGRYFNIPHANVLLIGFIGGGVFMGIMLSVAVKRTELGLR